MNLQKNVEREKYLSHQLEKLKGRMMEIECLRREVLQIKFHNKGKYDVNDEINEEIVKCLIEDNNGRIRELFAEQMVIKKGKEKCTMKFINKKYTYVSNSQELEAVIFLKKNGWKGFALIKNQDDLNQNKFTTQLRNNDIPFNFLLSTS